MGRRRREEFDSITQAVARIIRISTSRSGFAAQAEIAQVEISQPSYALMRAVIDLGPLSMSGLARATHMDVGMVTRQVGQLERSGYVTREADPVDQRVSLVSATDVGRGVAGAIQRLRRAHLEVALAGWSEEDLKTFDGLLTRFVEDTTGTSFQDLRWSPETSTHP